MTDHQRVIEQALKRLYQRIDMPTATDKIHLNAAMTAVRDFPMPYEAPKDQAADASSLSLPEPKPLEGANINAVQALVEQGKVTAAEALEFERASEFPRKTLITWLEDYLEDDDGD